MSIYLGEESKEFNSIVKKNRNESKKIEMFEIEVENSSFIGYKVEHNSKEGFVYYNQNGNFYNFNDLKEVNNYKSIGMHNYIDIDDMEYLRTSSSIDLLVNSRDENKNIKVDQIRVKGSVQLNGLFQGFKVNKEGKSGYIISLKQDDIGLNYDKTSNIKSYFLKEEYVDYINQDFGYKQILTNEESIGKSNDRKDIIDNLLKFVKEKNLDIKYIEDIKNDKISFFDLLQSKNLIEKYKSFEKDFNEKPISPEQPLSVYAYVYHIDKCRQHKASEKEIIDFNENFGFTLNIDYEKENNTGIISIRNNKGLQVSSLILNNFLYEEKLIGGDRGEALALDIEVFDFDFENLAELNDKTILISEDGKEFNNVNESKYSLIYNLFTDKSFTPFNGEQYDLINVKLSDLGIEETKNGLSIVECDVTDNKYLHKWMSSQLKLLSQNTLDEINSLFKKESNVKKLKF